MKDVIIVGGGISGCTLAWQWHIQGKSILWIADDIVASSHVAAGVFNPVVLKRFSPVWKAQEQLNDMLPFYEKVQNYVNHTLLHFTPVWRRFHDEKERKTWIRKSAREDLKKLMSTDPIDSMVDGIEADHGYGLVNNTGWLDTETYMQSSFDYFSARGEFRQEGFKSDSLIINSSYVTYLDIEATSIIFAEGIRLLENPWFKELPLQGNKGEILIIKCPDLRLNQIVKSSVFLMPYKEDLFWVGATYDRDYDDVEPTQNAKNFIISKLDAFLKLPYDIIFHKSGLRPTTIDRRPFVGHHSTHKNLYIFNGMGSRASLVTPWASQLLFENMYYGTDLPEEMDIARFDL